MFKRRPIKRWKSKERGQEAFVFSPHGKNISIQLSQVTGGESVVFCLSSKNFCNFSWLPA